jgi:lysophospholipase L1-like esterase
VSGQTFPRNHEGHDGWTINPGVSTYGAGGILSLIPSPALNGSPHIILLQIGTNDAGFITATTMITDLDNLLNKIAQNAPSALIVLAQTTPLGYSNSALTMYDGQIPALIQSHAAQGQHIIGVDMSKMPVPADIASDNVHPNDQGYAYMANIWYAAIKNLLPN